MMSKGIRTGLIETSKHIKKRGEIRIAAKEKSVRENGGGGDGGGSCWRRHERNGINNNRCSEILRCYGSADVFDNNATIGVAARYRPHLTCQYWQEAADDDNYMIRLITSKNKAGAHICVNRKRNVFFRSVHFRPDQVSDKILRSPHFRWQGATDTKIFNKVTKTS